MKNKIYKLLSIVLAIMVVFSCCSVALTAFAEETVSAEYYVSVPNGNDETGDGTSAAPFATISAALSKATADDKNVAGETVVIYVSNPSDTATHVWGSTTLTFDCDLILIGEKANTVLNATSSSDKMVSDLKGAGSLTLRNVKFVNRQWGTAIFWNKDIYLEEGCTWDNNGGTFAVGTRAQEGNKDANDVQNIVFKSSANRIHIGSGTYYGEYSNRFNFVYDVANGTTTYSFGCIRSASEGVFYTTYKNALNFNIKNGKTITFTKSSHPLYFKGENAQIQVINSANATISGLANVVNTVSTTDPETSETVTTTEAVPTWIINNTTTDFKDVLDFTSTVGVYDVAEGYTATAVKADDESVVVASAAPEGSQDVVLDLREGGVGTYNVTVEKFPETFTYYVASATDGGLSTNDGLKDTTPLLTVNEAIAKATAEGITSVDTLEVRIVGSNAVASEAHTTHDFKLAIKGNNSSVVAKLNGTLKLGGDTDFENVTVSGTSYLGGYNVNFGTNATLATTSGTAVPQYRSNKTYPDPINIYISKFAGYGITFRDYYGGYIYDQPVTVEVDNWAPAMSNERDGGLTIGGDTTYGKITYNAPLNIKLNSSTVRVVLKGSDASNMVFGEKAAFQLINSTGKVIAQTGDTLTRSDGETKIHTNALEAIDDSKEYILHNESGNKDLLDFTSEIGTYKVNSDVYEAIATSTGEDASVYRSENGYLKVPAGEYTITAEKIPNLEKTYYAQANAANGDGSEEKPFGSLNEAIVAANAEGYGTTDTVTVTVLGSTTLPWGAAISSDHNNNYALPTHTFKLVVNSETGTTTIGDDKGIVMGGDTHFENIQVNFGSGYSSVALNGTSSSFDRTSAYNGNALMSYLNIGSAGSSHSYPNAVNVYVGIPAHYFDIGNRYHTATYKKDVTIVYDAPSGQPRFKLGGTNSGSPSIFEGNLNIDLRAGANFTVNAGGGYTLNGYLQIVNSGDVNLLGTGESFYINGQTHAVNTCELDNLQDKLFYIINNTGETVSFTATAGVYEVSGTDTVYVYKNGAKVAESKNGVVDIHELGVGEYTFIKQRDPKTFNYTNASGATIAAIIDKAIADGAIEGDTVEITLTGSTAINYGAPKAHLFDVVIKSSENTPVYITNNTNLSGDTTFDGVVVKGDQSEHSMAFDGHNVTFTSASRIVGINNIFTANKSANAEYAEEQNVVINCECSALYLYVSGDWGTAKYGADLNITLATWVPTAYMGVHNTVTYEGTVNINAANGIKFADTTYAIYTGGLNIISKKALSDYTYVDGLAYDVYTVVDSEGLLDFGEGAGKFAVIGEDTVRAMSDTVYTDSSDGVLNLTVAGEGNYSVGVPHVYDGEESTYADYIDYRTALNGNDALNNFAAKVNAGEAVNVVYYGGSVTAGSGASDGDKTSWRGIISNWLEINAPKSNVTNINSAIGGTGSHFGFYRLDEAVLAKDPDLLFIEFSINDFYDNQDLWNIGEDKAAMQLESIVRKVRTKAPDCDIVIVLTTEESLISSLQTSDTLHAQARGHYKIAEKYGIPTLRVGHALADHLATTGEAWGDYVTDIVHPNDKGYQIYGGVVKEFMANSLLSDEAKAITEVKAHTVPDNIVSDTIWAGDPVFIAADAALNEESASLGGDTFTYYSGADNGRPYPYHESFFVMGDTEQVLKFKFTGTELSVLDDQYSHAYNGFNVKIDGGEEKYVEIRNYKPTVLASGLENTEHTAEIRIAEVNEGGNQWVYGFFVRNEADNIERKGQETTYYVSASATAGGNGLTEQTPFATVDEAIADAVSKGYGSRDEVTVKLIGTDTINWRLVDGELNTSTTSYGFKLYVESKDTANLSTVHMKYGTVMGGDTEFNNVKITTTSHYAQTGFWADGHNITVGDNVTYNPTDFAIGYASNSGSHPAQNIVFKSKITTVRFYLGNNSHFNSRRYTEDVNITIDNAASAPKLSTNVGYGPGITFYEKNLNLNIQDAASISVVENNGMGYLSVKGAIQVYLNNPDTVFSDESKTYLAGCAALSDGEPVANKIYYITNNSGLDNIVEFVPGEAGKLKVNLDTSRYTIYVNGEEASVADGLIDLGSQGGDFSLTVTKVYEQLTYYVSAEGNDTTGDGSMGAPYKTVMKAVEDANTKGLVPTDDVVVNVVGTAQVRYGVKDKVNLETAHTYTLTIQSADSANKGTVYFGQPKTEASDGENHEKWLMGDTVFKNITVSDIGSVLHVNGHNVTLDEGVTAPGTIELSEQEKTHNDEQTLIIRNAYTGSVHLSNGNYSAIKHNADVNIIIDNANADVSIGGTAYWGGGATHYYANLNIIAKQAKGIKFTGNAKSDDNGTMSTVVDGAINLLLPSNVTLTDASRTNLAALTTNVYEVVNALGNTGTIEFVDGSTGEYTVNVDKYFNAYVTDEQGNSTLIQGTDLTLETAGRYIVSSTRKSDNFTYYAAAGGTGDGSSAQSPLGSVNAVIEKAIAEGWNDKTLTVKLMVTGTETLPWTADGTDKLTAYNFNFIIDSETEGAKVGNGSTIHMAGNVEINNVQLVMGGTEQVYTTFGLNGYDAVIGDNVTSDGYTWSFVYGRHSGGCAPKDDQYVTINSDMGQALTGFGISNGMSAATYNVNVYVTYNVSGASPRFSFDSSWGDSKYYGNITIDLVKASGATFVITLGDGTGDGSAQCLFGTDAKVQVIDRAGLGINSQTAGLANIADKLWVIEDNLGELGTLTASATSVGTYTVEYDDILYKVVANGANTYEAEGATLSVPVAGTYEVVAARRQVADVLYVSADGSSVALGTEASPFDTIASAVAAAKDSGYGKGDTLTIKLMGDSVDMGSLPTYEFDLAVLSNNQNVKTKITLTDSVVLANGEGAHTHFSNVKIVRSNQYSSIQLRDSNVTFDSDVTFEVGYGTALIFGSSSDDGSNNSIAGQKVIINTDVPTTYISNWSWSGRTNTEDVEVVLNNANLDATIAFNADDEGMVNGTTMFDKNLNINIKDAKALAFANGEGVGVKGGFQIINSTDIAITAETAGIADVTGSKWIINNKLGVDDIAFTETAGTFTIANFDSTTHYLLVTDANGDATEYNASTITLPAGEYTIEKVRHPRSASYTVSTASTEGLVSIEAAVLKANDEGYGKGDTVTFNISGETAVPFAATLSSPARLTAFEYQLIIQTAEGEDRRTIGGEKKTVNLSGDVEFKNIKIDVNGEVNNYPTLGLGGNNVKFNSDVVYAGVMWGLVSGYNQNSLVAEDDVNIYLGTPVTDDGQSFKIGNSYTGNTYKADVNITHNAKSAIKFTFGTRSNELTHFKRNVNINIMQATSVGFGNAGSDFAVGSVLQIINSTANEITSSTNIIKDLVDVEGNALPKYIITNDTEMPEALSFTKTAGVYKVDMGDYDTSRYYLVATDSNGKTVKSVGDTLDLTKLGAGEYTVTVGKPSESAEFLVETGTQYATLADAVIAANEAGFMADDDVVIKVSGNSIEAGTIPTYSFDLVVESYDPDNKTVINVNGSMLANNEGGKTEYKNVDIKFAKSDSWVGLGGANVTFDKNVVIDGYWNNTIAFGSNDDGGNSNTIDGDQTLVLNGQFLTTSGTKSYINLSNTGWAKRTYNGDVTLVVDNSKAAPVIGFNAYYESEANGTTAYNRNLNLNIRNAKSVTFNNKNGGNVSGDSFVQLITNANTTISDEDLEWLKADYTYGYFYHLIDKSFQRDILETTSEAGVFRVNTDLKVTATQVDYWDEDGNIDTSVDRVVVAENGILDLRDNGNAEGGIGTWEITTEEFFEDFDNFDYEDLATDWFDNHSAYNGVCEITEDGKLLVESINGVPNKSCIVMNRNINSLTQYVSVDIDPEGYKSYDAGAVIYARASSNHKSYYSLSLVNGIVRVNKFLGEANTSGNYVSTTTGWDTTGLNKRLPYSSKNMVTFNNEHNYRMGMSIVDIDGSAYVRAFVLNLNTNEYIFDETFKDDQPLTNTGIGFSVEGSGETTSKDYCNTYFDNFYFSTEGFRVGDEGQIAGDINRDGVFDLRDLVYTSEAVTDKSVEITLNVADKNQTGSIDDGDLPVIRKELLTGVEDKEFDYEGYADAEADALRNQILNATSTVSNKVYTATNNGETVLTHTITGKIWYVSETGAGAHNGTSPENAWTLEELNANADTGAGGTNVDNKTIKSGDAVLFERGSEFRLTDNLVRDEAVDGQANDYYGYLVGQEGVLYGAYGTGAKPKFIDSARNYAEADWTEVDGQENIWVVDAPEIIIDNGTTKDGGSNGKKATDNGATNMIFNDGAKIGQRRAFTYADNLYTMYKDGQFTYDESTGKLYLYSIVDPTTYDSIEVSRGISGMMWNAGENNIVVDNLAFQGFAGGAMGGIYGTHTVTVTNCEVGYSGGVQRVDDEEQTSLCWGNAIGIWCGGKDFKVNHNWIYQTFDTAISPQGNTATNYDGFQVIGNLLEYNNCDIEIFDRGTGSGVAESKSATWNNTKFTDNIMRFTTLGWGSRHADQIRGIQGVIRGSVTDASVVAIDWTNNIIDTPGMEIFKLDNTTNFQTEGEGESAKDITLAIWKFGTSYTEGATAGTSLLGNNKYYLNPYVRAGSYIATDYMTMTPDDYKEAHDGQSENTGRTAMSADEFYNSMSAIDTADTSEFYWLGKKVG